VIQEKPMLDYCEPPGIHEWHEPEPVWIDAGDAEQHGALYAERALSAALKAARPLGKSLDARSIEIRFREQADKWERETAYLSATPMIVMHESYQTIMSMGPDVVPILLHDLQKTRRHWFWALRHLEPNADPVPTKDQGNVDKMIEAWVNWGKKEGKI
jgi:hypothetical protein